MNWGILSSIFLEITLVYIILNNMKNMNYKLKCSQNRKWCEVKFGNGKHCICIWNITKFVHIYHINDDNTYIHIYI